MRTLFFLLCMVTIQASAFAQNAQDKALYASLNADIRIDQLFEARSSLLSSGKSTREIDRELAGLGVRFPAKVKLKELNGKTTLAFVIIEDYETSAVLEKIEKLKHSMPEIAYLGIDSFNHQCYATFADRVPERKIEKLLAEFLYDGFYISSAPKIQLGALSR